MAGGRHGPARFSHYLRAHQGDLAGLIREGFVHAGQTLEFESAPGGFIAEGEIHCTGGIVVHIRKLAEVVGEEGNPPEPVVRTRWYSYNVALQGLGNLFRYDGPDPDPTAAGHHAGHHVHRYDALAGDREGTVESIEDPEEVPHVGDVFREASAWYYSQLAELRDRGVVASE